MLGWSGRRHKDASGRPNNDVKQIKHRSFILIDVTNRISLKKFDGIFPLYIDVGLTKVWRIKHFCKKDQICEKGGLFTRLISNGKGKIPVHATNGGIAPPILNFDTGLWCVFSLTLWPLYTSGKELPVRSEYEAEWAPDTYEERKKISFSGIEKHFLGCSTHGLVTISTELSRFQS